MVSSRFLNKDLRLLIVLLIVAKWLLLTSFHTSLATAERSQRLPNQNRGRALCLLFVPFHVAFIGLLVASFIPNLGAYCHEVLTWPLVLSIMEFVFSALLLAIWSVFVFNNCMETLCDT